MVKIAILIATRIALVFCFIMTKFTAQLHIAFCELPKRGKGLLLAISVTFAFLFVFANGNQFTERVHSAANSTINFQGKIVNKTDGTKVTAGSPSCVVGGADTCDFRVNIYDDVDTPAFAVDTSGTLETSLMAYYDLEETSGTRYDSIGSNDLTDNNTVTSNPGKIGTAGQFTASSSEYLSIADNADLSTGDIDFTVAAWVYLDSKSGSRALVGKMTTPISSDEYSLYYSSVYDRFSLEVRYSGGTTGTVRADTFGSPSTGTWYYVVAWHDSTSDQLGIQVNNGTADTLSTSGNAPADTSADFFIGRYDGGTFHMDGRIDEVGFWKKLLSTQEKTDLYNSGSGNEYLDDIPIWTETHENVELGDNDGVFQLSFNSICNSWTNPTSPCSGTGFTWGDNPNLEFEIEFDDDGDGDFAEGETFSRKTLDSVPYAYYADVAGAFAEGSEMGNAVEVQPDSAQIVGGGEYAWVDREDSGAGGALAHDVATDQSGNVVVAGYYTGTVDFGAGSWTPTGSQGYFVVKYDSEGNYVWADREDSMGVSNSVEALSIDTDSDGNVFVAGIFTGSTGVNFGAGSWTPVGVDYFVIKYNSSGTYQWVDREDSGIGNAYAYGVAVDGAGNVFVGGYFNSSAIDFGAGSWTPTSDDYFVVKYNSAGVYQAADREDSGAGSAKVYGIAADSSGNVYATGTFGNAAVDFGAGSWTPTGIDYFVIKYNNSLSYQTVDREDSGSGNVFSIDVTTDSSDNVYVAGYFTGTIDFGAGSWTASGVDYFLVKYDSSLTYQWVDREDGGTGSAYANEVSTDSQGNVYVTGYFTSSGIDFGTGELTPTSNDYFVVRYNSSGTVQWVGREEGGVGDARAEGIAVDSNGNAYVTGYFTSVTDFGAGSWTPSGNDYFVLKMNSWQYTQQVPQWADREDSGSAHAWAMDVTTDNFGNIYVTGYFNGTVDFGEGSWTSGGIRDYFVIKYDSTGAFQWADREDSGTGVVYAYEISVDSSGNVYVAGHFNTAAVDFGAGSWTPSNNDYFIIKYNSSGAYQWVDREDSGTGSVNVDGLATDSMGNVYVGGYFSAAAVDFGAGSWTPAGADYFIVKYNSAGTYQWADREDSGTGSAYLRAIAIDESDNVYIVGNFNVAALDFGAGSWTPSGRDYFILKYNSAGVYQWADREDSGSGDARAWEVATDSSGNVYITGDFYTAAVDFGAGSWTPGGTYDYFVMKYNSAGTYQWADREDSGSGDVGPKAIAVDDEGNVYVAGGFYTAAVDFGAGSWTPSSEDYFIIKYDSNGNYQWADREDSGAGFARATGVAIDGVGNIYVAGYFSGIVDFGTGDGSLTSSGNDYLVLKYSDDTPYDMGYLWADREDSGSGSVIAYDMATDSSGNVYVGGNFSGTVDFGAGDWTAGGTYDYFVVKYNNLGEFQWADREDSGTGDVRVQGMASDSSGNVYVTGYFYTAAVDFGAGSWTPSGNDYFVIKYNTLGEYQWADREDSGTGSVRAFKVAADNSGNVYVSGDFITAAVNFGAGSWTPSGYDYFVIKYNSAGTYQWADRENSGTGNVSANDVAVDASGNVYVTGYFYTAAVDFGAGSWTPSSQDYFVIKYNSAGTYQWVDREDSGAGGVYSIGASTDSNGNVYVAGTFTGTVDFGAGSWTAGGTNDYFVAKYNTNGVFQWADRESGGTGDAIGYRVTTDSADNVYVVGYFTGTVDFGAGLWSASGNDYFIVKYSSSGVYQWADREDSGTGSVWAYGVATDNSGNVYVAGFFDTAAVDFGAGSWTPSGDDYFIVRYSEPGPIIYLNDSGSGTPDLLDLQVSGSTVFLVDNDGNVGIGGVTDPDAFIDITSATAASAQINFTAGGNPAAPISGDMWWNGNEFYFNDGTVDQDLLTVGAIDPVYSNTSTSVADGSYLEVNHAQATTSLLSSAFLKDSSSGKYTEVISAQGRNHDPDDANLLGYWKMDEASGNLTDSKTADVSKFSVDTNGTLSQSLSAYYKLDEQSGTRVDAAQESDLTDNNTVTYNASGIQGNAAEFTATNSEYLSISDNDDISTGDIDFSVSVWVYLNSKSNYQEIVTHFSASSYGYFLQYDNASDRFHWHVGNGATTWVGSVLANNLGSPSTGTWYHIVAWHDITNNQAGIQVDNGTADIAATTGAAGNSSGTFEVGSYANGTAYFMDGRIDELGLWKKVLSTQEKTDLYNSGSGNTCTDDCTDVKKPLIAGSTSDSLYKQTGKVENGSSNTYYGFNNDSGGKLRDRLVAYWDLDETSGTRSDYYRSNDLTDNNTVTYGTGKQGNAAQFDYTAPEYLSSSDNSDLSSGDIGFTVSAWVYLTEDTLNHRAVLSKASGSGSLEYLILYNYTGDYFTWYVGDSAGTGWAATPSTAAGIEPNTWYHIVAWHDPVANVAGIQLDDANPVIASTTSTPADLGGNFYIGTYTTSLSYPWDGMIDEVGYWKRVLSAQEREDLYNGGSATTMNNSATSYMGSSIDFDGSADYFCSGTGTTCSDDDYFDPGTDVITVGAWVKEEYSAAFNTILVKDSTPALPDGAYLFGINSGVLQAGIGTATAGNWAWAGTSTVDPNVWNHVVMRYDGSIGRLYFYINGELDSSINAGNSQSGTINNTVAPFAIGQRVGHSANYFSGQIDEVFVYDRALSDGEVKNLYNYGAKQYKVEVTDTNNVRLYNFSGSTQDLKLDVIVKDTSGGLWFEGTNGIYSNTEAIIVGTDAAFEYVSSAGAGDFKVSDDAEILGNLYTGGDMVVGAGTSTTSTIASGFTLGGNDLFVAGSVGVEGDIYTDGDLYLQTDVDTTSSGEVSLVFGGTNAEELYWSDYEDAFMISDDLLPGADDTYDLGGATLRFQDVYLGPDSIHLGTAGDEAIISYDTAENYFGLDPDGDGFDEFKVLENGTVRLSAESTDAFLDLAMNTTTNAQLNMSPGSDPSSPGNGDFWFNGTELNFHDGSTEHNLLDLAGGSGSWTDAGSYIYANNATNVRVTDTGKVSINSPTPTADLEVSGSVEFSISFDYKVDISVGNTGSELTDHELLVEINTATPILAGKMQDDCGDIRFKDSNESNLLYWIESGCDATNTQIWVTVPVIPNGGTTITMFYGNDGIVAGGETFVGDFIMTSNASCPVGWTTDSSFDTNYMRGSNVYGITGGSSSHSHSYNFSIYSGSYAGRFPNASVYSGNHSHTLSGTLPSDSHLAPYRDVIVCKRTGTSTATVPTNFFGMYQTIPGGWSSTSVMDDRIPRGNTSYGGTGGTSTHSHATGTQTSSGVWGAYSPGASNWPNVPTQACASHTHTYSLSVETSNYPKYNTMKFANPTSATELAEGVVVGFSGEPPMGWTQYTNLNGRFPRGTAGSADSQGGSDSEAHSLTGSTSSANPSNCDAFWVDWNTSGRASVAHSHTISGQSSNVSKLPPYKQLIYYQKDSTPAGVSVTPGSESAATSSVGFKFDGDTHRVGVGTSAPSVKFHVVGDGTYAAAFMSGNVGIGVADPEYSLELLSGAHVLNGTSFEPPSDESLKYDIVDSPYGLAELLLLRPRQYKFNLDDSPSVGFIAQEVMAVIPELVSGSEEDYYGVKYSNITAVITSGLQELNLKVDGFSNSFETKNIKVVDSALFSGTFTLNDHLIFGGDSVGRAQVIAGDSEVDVVFDVPYDNQPVVHISPRGQEHLTSSLKYSLENETINGFTIKLDAVQAEDIEFNWYAVGTQ